MRVLIVCGPYLYGTGARASGQAVQNRRLARALATSGNVVSVFSVDEDESDIEVDRTQVSDGVEVTLCRPSTMIQTAVRRTNLFGLAILNRAIAEFTWNFIYPKSKTLLETLKPRIERFHPDTVIFIAEPYFIPLLGLQLGSCNGATRIAVFSDPWPYEKLPPPYNKYAIPFANKYNRGLISRVFSHFDRIIYTTSAAIEFMCASYPELKQYSGKLGVVEHFADDLVATPSKELVERVRSSVVHFGYLTKERFTTQLKSAMIQLIKSHGISFTFIGPVCDSLQRSLDLGEFGGGVSLIGSLPDIYSRYISNIALVNLIVEANIENSPFMPSKFTDIVTSSSRWVFISGTRRHPNFGATPDGTVGGACVFHENSAIVEAILAVARRATVSGDPCLESLRASAVERNRNLAARFLD